MKKIYEVSGTLNRGFVGQISYTVCLDREYEQMDVCFSFEKQRYEEITEKLISELKGVCDALSLPIGEPGAEDIHSAISGMKTEIHTLASMNDVFIGGIHKQLTKRHMEYRPGFASDGCLPQEKLEGVIKITLLVFNVLLDETPYTLSLSVG